VTKLHDAGLLGPDLNAVHCNMVTDEELKFLVDAGVSISVTPVVELLMALGTPVGGRVRQLGGRLSYGADVVVGTGTDMFRQMQTALAIERGVDNQRRLDAGDYMETVTPGVREILVDATAGGAAALGRDGRIGTITPGKQADIIMLDTGAPNMGPLSHAIGATVLSADTRNVDTVIVAGRIVKRNGELVGVDRRRVLELARASQEHLLAGLSLTPDSWATPRD
jgi:5-methylthioadenosine/S-adenosylhomocysteine deaminase